MSKIKDKIKSEFYNETPNVKERILESIDGVEQEVFQIDCENTKPTFNTFKRVAFSLSFILLFSLGILTGYFIPKNQAIPQTETTVYIDVNPSVEISLSSSNHVLSCKAVNDDAEKILSGMELDGVNLDTALSAIVGSLYVNGYLTADENAMLISVDSSTEDKTNQLLRGIIDKVNSVFENNEINCNIIAQAVEGEGELKDKATNNGVSVGKMNLIDKVVSSFDEFDEESVKDLINMSIKELNHIYSNKPKDNEQKPNEIVSGTASGYADKNVVVSAILSYLQMSEDQVRICNFSIRPKINGIMEIVYAIKIENVNSGKIYEIEVDCKTGEILSVKEQFDNRGEGHGNFF